MPPKRQSKQQSRRSPAKQRRRKSGREPKRRPEKVGDLPSCPLKYGLQQVRDRQTRQCKLVAANLQKLSPDRRALSVIAIGLDKLAEQMIANIEIARKATFALQDNPLNKKAYNLLGSTSRQLDELNAKIAKLWQETSELISNNGLEPSVASDANTLLSVVENMTNEINKSYSAIEKVVKIPKTSSNANTIIREARNAQHQLEKAQRASARANDTAAVPMQTALGVLGGAALIGGGLALAKSRLASQTPVDEPTDVAKEQAVRNVVVSRIQESSAASVVDQTLNEERKLQLANEERLRYLRQQLNQRRQQFDEIKTRHQKLIVLFLTQKDVLETKLSGFEEKIRVASELSRKLAKDNEQLLQIRKSLDDINENIKKANEKIARNEWSQEMIVQAVKSSDISRRSLEAELQTAKQIAQDNKIKLDELIVGLADPINRIRSMLEIIESTASQIENDRGMLHTISDEVAKLRQQLLEISQNKTLVFEAFDLGDETKIPVDVAEILTHVVELEKQIAELQKLSEQTKTALDMIPARVEIFTNELSSEQLRDLINNPNNRTSGMVTRSQTGKAKANFVSEEDAWKLLATQLEGSTLSVQGHLSLMYQFLRYGNVFVSNAKGNIKVLRTPERIQAMAAVLEKIQKRFDDDPPRDERLHASVRRSISTNKKLLTGTQSINQLQRQ